MSDLDMIDIQYALECALEALLEAQDRLSKVQKALTKIDERIFKRKCYGDA